VVILCVDYDFNHTVRHFMIPLRFLLLFRWHRCRFIPFVWTGYIHKSGHVYVLNSNVSIICYKRRHSNPAPGHHVRVS